MSTWTSDTARAMTAPQEVQVATRRADGTLRRPRTIWIVRDGVRVFIRSTNGRGTGEHGEADGKSIERVVVMILAGRHVQYHVREQEREQKLSNECNGDFPAGERQRLNRVWIYDHARSDGA